MSGHVEFDSAAIWIEYCETASQADFDQSMSELFRLWSSCRVSHPASAVGLFALFDKGDDIYATRFGSPYFPF